MAAKEREYQEIPVPHDLQAESAVIGSLLLDRDSIVKVAGSLSAADFYREHHGFIYAAILSLYERREPPDAVTLADELTRRGQLERIGGYSALVSAANEVPTAVHIEYYAQIVKRRAVQRRLIQEGGAIAALGFDDALSEDEMLSKAAAHLRGVGTSRKGGFVHVSEVVDRHTTRTERDRERVAQGEVLGIPTGIAEFDRITGGLQRGDFIMPAARPAVGKTALAISWAMHAVKRGHRTAVIELEMSDERLLDRVYSAETGLLARDIREGNLTDEQWSRYAGAQGRIAEWPLFIDDRGGLNIAEIEAQTLRLQAEHGIDLLIIDYVQLIAGSGNLKARRQEEVAEVSRRLKRLARQLDIPVVGCAQLNRGAADQAHHAPRLEHLRESGALEQDTDIVVLIHRPELYEPTAANRNRAELHIAKHRNGATDMVECFFDGAHNRFTSLSYAEEEVPQPDTPPARNSMLERMARQEAEAYRARTATEQPVTASSSAAVEASPKDSDDFDWLNDD